MRFLRRSIGVAAAAAMATVLLGSSTLAASGARTNGVTFFQGVKTCRGPNPTPPEIVCQITTSNVALLQGATIAYTSVPAIFGEPAPGRIDSDVSLTTVDPDAQASTADGHCTFYFATGTGVCTFNSGTHDLAGFHAVLSIGTVDAHAGTYSTIGKYWVGDGGDH